MSLIEINRNPEEPIGNQGNVRSDAIYDQRDGNFKFKTIQEVAFWRAMKLFFKKNLPPKSVAMLPMCPVVFFDPYQKHIEPDFLVVYRKKNFIIEIDGSSHTWVSAAKEQKRLEVLTFNGFMTLRIDNPPAGSSNQELMQWAEISAKDCFQKMNFYIDGWSS